MVENEKRRKYIMPTLHSHTHCQAAPANAQTKAWQRVCLSSRTTENSDMKDKLTDEKEHRSDNTGLANWRFSAPQTHLWLIKHWFSADTFVVKATPHLRQARNRYA